MLLNGCPHRDRHQPRGAASDTELFFGYSDTDRAVFTHLIDIGSYTCSNTL